MCATRSRSDPVERQDEQPKRMRTEAPDASLVFEIIVRTIMANAARRGNDMPAVEMAVLLGRLALSCRAGCRAVRKCCARGTLAGDPAWARVNAVVEIHRFLPRPLWRACRRNRDNDTVVMVGGQFVARFFWPGNGMRSPRWSQPDPMKVYLIGALEICSVCKRGEGGRFPDCRCCGFLLSHVGKETFADHAAYITGEQRCIQSITYGQYIKHGDLAYILPATAEDLEFKQDRYDTTDLDARIAHYPAYSHRIDSLPHATHVHCVGTSSDGKKPSCQSVITENEMMLDRVMFDGHRIICPWQFAFSRVVDNDDLYCRHCKGPRIILAGTPRAYAPRKRDVEIIWSHAEGADSMVKAYVELLRIINKRIDQGFVTCSPGPFDGGSCLPNDGVCPMSGRYLLHDTTEPE